MFSSHDNLRILAVEDGGLQGKKAGQRVLLLGILARNFAVEAVYTSTIAVDGLDATDRLIRMVGRKRRISLIMLASISYGGFNLMDPVEIYGRLRIPVVIANPEKPNNLAVRAALSKHFSDWKERFEVFRKVGTPSRVALSQGGKVYLHAVGVPKAEAVKIVRQLTIFGNRPEPLRIARIMARELSKAGLC